MEKNENKNYQRLKLIEHKLKTAKAAPMLKKPAAVEMVIEDALHLLECIILDVEALKRGG